MLANPTIIESLLFGQQAFAWGSALLLFGVAAWRRKRPLAEADQRLSIIGGRQLAVGVPGARNMRIIRNAFSRPR